MTSHCSSFASTATATATVRERRRLASSAIEPGPVAPLARSGLNLLLVRLGFPPAIIYKGGRQRYLVTCVVPTLAIRARSTTSTAPLATGARRG